MLITTSSELNIIVEQVPKELQISKDISEIKKYSPMPSDKSKLFFIII